VASKASKSRYSTGSKTVAAGLVKADRAVRSPTVDTLSQQRAEFNRAWSEYSLGNLEEAKSLLMKLSSDLEHHLALTTKESDRGPIRLLYGSTMSALGRVYQRLDSNEAAQSEFRKAVFEFRKSLPSQQATDMTYCDYGVALFHIGKHNKSVEAFMEAKKRGVLNAEANRYLGISQERMGDIKEAEKYFKEAIKQAPTDYSTYITLAKFYEKQKRIDDAIEHYGVAINYLTSANLLDEAIKVVNRLLKLTKQDPQMLALKAEIQRQKADLYSALKTVDVSLKRDPKRAYAWAVKGLIFLDKRDNDTAIELLQKAIKLDPAMDWAHVDLAGALYNTGNFDKALSVLERALELQPTNPDAWYWKGDVLYRLNRPKEALEAFDQVLTFVPNDAKSLGAKGQVLSDLNQSQRALKVLRRSIEIDPTLAWVHSELGWVLYRLGRNDEALHALNNALAIQPDNVIALQRKAEVLRTLGKLEEALQVSHQAVRLDPEDAWALGTKGQILRDLGRDREAVETLRSALDHDPKMAWLCVELSAALYNLDELEASLQILDQALNIEEHDDWQFFKANILCEIGEFSRAVKALDRSIALGQTLPERHGLKGWALQHVGPKYFKEALEAYQKAAKLDPDNLWWHKGVANGFYLLGQMTKADEKYRWVLRRAKQHVKDDDTLLSLIGWCDYRLGNWESAVNWFNQVLLRQPDEVAIQFDMALALLCWEHHTEGLREYRRGTAIAQGKHRLRCRALVHVAKDDLKAAIDHIPGMKEQCGTRDAMLLLQSVYDQTSSAK
jgi:tetratricopeptide (TPR) repeat protein